jgi:hypothetical protein
MFTILGCFFSAAAAAQADTRIKMDQLLMQQSQAARITG